MDLLIWQLAPDVMCFKAIQLCQACDPSPRCGIKRPMSSSLYFVLSSRTEGDSGHGRSLLRHSLTTSPVGCLFLTWDFGFRLLLAMWHLLEGLWKPGSCLIIWKLDSLCGQSSLSQNRNKNRVYIHTDMRLLGRSSSKHLSTVLTLGRILLDGADKKKNGEARFCSRGLSKSRVRKKLFPQASWEN